MSTADAALAAVADVEGWLTEAQARRLHAAAAALAAPARIVEIGSFRGRSTIVLASAAASGVELVAIDPHLGSDRGPREIAAQPGLGAADLAAFEANLQRAGVRERVRHVRLSSQEALAAVDGPIDLLYVDGAHRYAPARDDLRRWGARVKPGGTLLVHDAFSSVGVTLALLRVLHGRGWRYLGRSRSLAAYRREPRYHPLAFARELAQLPWFARNLAIKLAIVARLGPVTRLLGHRSANWPY